MTVPNTPSNKPRKGAGSSDTQIVIEFDAISGATSYDIYWDTGSGTSFIKLDSTTSLSYTQV